MSEPPDRASYRAARPSVIGPMRTAEVRWVLPGQLDAAVTGWFGASPVELDMSHSQSYADWLSRHRVTAAFHRQEGEESPAR